MISIVSYQCFGSRKTNNPCHENPMIHNANENDTKRTKVLKSIHGDKDSAKKNLTSMPFFLSIVTIFSWCSLSIALFFALDQVGYCCFIKIHSSFITLLLFSDERLLFLFKISSSVYTDFFCA